MPKEVMIGTRITKEDHQALKGAAKREDASVAQIVRRAIRCELGRLEAEAKRGRGR